jgi:hypothetical protein
LVTVANGVAGRLLAFLGLYPISPGRAELGKKRAGHLFRALALKFKASKRYRYFHDFFNIVYS